MKTIASLSVLLILASCGGSGTGSKSDYPRSSNEPLTASSPQVIPSYNFSEGMGLLVVKKAGKMGVCTSFMITQDELMTNSHCLQDLSLTQSCAKNVVVHVKTATGGHEFRRCKKILVRSEIDGGFGKPDFAIIKLDSPVNVKPMTLSRDGVSELAEVTVESVDFTGDSETLIATKKISKCTPHMNAVIGNYSNPKSSIIPIYGDAGQACNVIPGNSGSPMKDANGKVISVVFATLYKDRLRSRMNIKNPFDTALATNIACIKTGVAWFDQLRPADCNEVLREEAQYGAKLDARFTNRKDENRKANSEKLLKELPGAFSFALEEKREAKEEIKEKYSYSFKPTCMKSLDSWSEEEKLKIYTEGSKRKYSTTVSSFSYALDLQLDDYLRPDVSSVLTKTGYYEIIVDNIDSKDTMVKIKIAKSENGVVNTTEQVVSRCQNVRQ